MRSCKTLVRRAGSRPIGVLLAAFVAVPPIVALQQRPGTAVATPPAAESRAEGRPVQYRVTFPEPEHRWMQVEAVFRDLGASALQVRMSRSSPGRYALHEFVKNVFDVRAYGEGGGELPATQADPYGWEVSGHGGAVRFVYKIYGDRVDGTYFAVDTTHAHMNIPATLVWARGLELRPAEVRFEPPAGSNWKAATQLFGTPDPMVFTAPNVQYLMDSPVELSAFTLRSFTAGPGAAGPAFRIALHHDGTDAEADAFARDVEKIVRETHAVYGEFPAYDGGAYTFLADYLPYAGGDGMEHRNSTVLTSSGALRNPSERLSLLGTVAHEFFHGWNVERIRPRSLEPFDFERANMSGELWLGEGVTSYYDALLMRRTGLARLEDTTADFASLVNQVAFSPARRFRSAAEMSRLAPFVDAARSIDRTYWDNTFISYYTWGAAIGLGLDLTLRDRSDGRVTLDDFMRAMWRAHGRPGGAAPGFVSAPYTLQDAEERLAEVSGDPAFAADFFRRFVFGRDIVPYERLLARAGLLLRKARPGRASLGGVRLEYGGGGARVAAPAPMGSAIYLAGLDQDDVIVSLDGEAVSSAERLQAFLASKRPGDRVTAVYRRRDGDGKASVQLQEAAPLEIVPIEQAGGSLGSAAKAFREAWLGPRS